jgi:ABC-type multidrug transport system permease subunit
MLHIALKDIRIFLTDRKAVLLGFLLPIALITLFALAFGGIGKNISQEPTKLPVSDLDKSELSVKMITDLGGVRGLETELLDTADALGLIREGKRLALLVFYPGFGDSVHLGGTLPLELFYDQSREMEMGILQQALYSSLYVTIEKESGKARAIRHIDVMYKDMPAPLREQIKKDLAARFEGTPSGGQETQSIKTTGVFRKQEVNWGLLQAVAGVSVMMLLFSVAAMGATILAEKEEGTLRRLLTTPLKPMSILSGKLLFTLVVSLIQLLVMFLFSWLVFGLDITEDLPSLLAMILATAFACCSFGIFLAAVCSTRKQVESLSVLIIILMSAIGGSMVPLFIMPAFMKKLAVISLNFWSINGMYDIFWRHLPFHKVAINALVLVGIGLLMTLVSLRLFRRNLLKVV